MFGHHRRFEDALNRHERDCREDRDRTAKAFEVFAKTLEAVNNTIENRHQQNRRSIQGVYALLWSIAGGTFLILITALGALLSKVVHLG